MKASPEIVKEAARWTAILDSDDVKQAQRSAWERWCAQDPLHRQVFDQMRAFGNSIESLSDTERRALVRMGRRKGPHRARRRAAVLGLAAAMLAAGWLISQSDPAREPWPDYRTARGELRTLTLHDTSTLILDTDSAVSADFDSGARRITLHRGRLHTSVARDPFRPFIVKTRDGTATALGTTFTVTRRDTDTMVEVFESRVRACASKTGACLDLGPGQRALITATGVTRNREEDGQPELDWTQGWLAVDDRPLAEVLTTLGRYTLRPVRFDERALAGLRITGSYPLRDPERAIDSIAAHLGLNLETLPDGGIAVRRSR